MSIRGLKAFSESGLDFFEFRPNPFQFDTPQSECDFSLSYFSSKSSKSPSVASRKLSPRSIRDAGIRKKGKKVRFLGDLEVPHYSPAKLWKDRGYTPRRMCSFWNEKYKESECESSLALGERTFWYTLGRDWGWDSLWSLDVERRCFFSETLKRSVVSEPCAPFYGSQDFQLA